MRRAVDTRKSAWLVLCVGFGGLLIFIAAAAGSAWLVLERVRTEEHQIRLGYLERLHLLDEIRSRIYLSGTYVRDFLISPDARGIEAQRERLAGLERETRSVLDAYARGLDPNERQPFAELRAEIDAYWKVLGRTVSWTREERERLRSAFFYDQMLPRRNSMLQIADRIADVNQRGLARSEERMAESAGRLRWSLAATFGVTLLGSGGLAVVTVLLMLRLEKELERRVEENSAARANLQELSAKLLRAQESERRRLARELHDEVGQSLSAIRLGVENAECAAGLEEAREHLAQVRLLAEKTVAVVRDMALLLRPSMLDDLGLVPALNWHVREMSKRTGLRISLAADEAANELPEEHTTCIYRLVQEAISNAVRHASARNIQVTVRRQETCVLFTVRDDGAGFDARAVRGMGLLGMEERVRRLGGKFKLDSQPGCGTLIIAELPLANLDGK